jgi:hypothetical protein
LEAAFVLLEFSSPSRRIFIGSHSLPPSLVRRIGPSDIASLWHMVTVDRKECEKTLPEGLGTKHLSKMDA